MYQEDKDWGKACLPQGASCYSIRQKLWLLHAAVNDTAFGQTLWLRAFSE